MHWRERQRAIVNVGLALRERGWTLHGYRESRSDPRTDYYDPADWDGVATHDDHPDVVVVVDGTEFEKREYAHLDVRPTPANKTWHVQRGGEIVTAGVRPTPCARSKREAGTLADRIVRAAAKAEAADAAEESVLGGGF